MKKLKELWRNVKIWRRREADFDAGVELIAGEDFRAGDELVLYGDTLYRWDPLGKLRPGFKARRDFRIGRKVRFDPTDPRSDISVIWEVEV